MKLTTILANAIALPAAAASAQSTTTRSFYNERGSIRWQLGHPWQLDELLGRPRPVLGQLNPPRQLHLIL